MMVVRSSTVVDVPTEQAGHHWADFVRQRLCDRNFVPDEWLVKDNACGVFGSGDVTFEPVSVARMRVTLGAARLVAVRPRYRPGSRKDLSPGGRPSGSLSRLRRDALKLAAGGRPAWDAGR